MQLLKISSDEWSKLVVDSHLAIFEEKMLPGYDRIDFAYLYVKDGKYLGYMTVRETDAETAYLKHGGVFEPYRNKPSTWTIYIKALMQLQETYKRITTFVANTNRAYLRMAITAGFKIIGMKYCDSVILLELFLGEE